MPPWKRRRPTGDDQGFSLVEILVTTAITAVVTVVSVTAIVQIYTGTKQIEQNSVAGDQLDTSYTRLDRQLRYATYVSRPGWVGTTRQYVEFATPPQGTDTTPRCWQLRFDTAQKTLTMADWKAGAAQGTTATTLATDVSPQAGTDPFFVAWPGDQPYLSASAGTTGVGTVFNTKYLMFRIRFQVRVGDVTQRFDQAFTSQNVLEETDGDEPSDIVPDPDKTCGTAGRA